MFEAVPGAAASEPHIAHFRVPVDQEVTVGGVFVLADARLDDGGIPQCRKSACYMRANLLQRT